MIDTNEIRNRLFWADGKPSEAAGDVIGDLCDALDEARARLREQERPVSDAMAVAQRNLARTVAGSLLDRCEKAEAAIARVRALHAAITWHEECISSARHGRCLVKPDDHFYVGDDGIKTCEPNRLPDVCGHCTPEYDGHDLRVNWPCPTLVALDGTS